MYYACPCGGHWMGEEKRYQKHIATKMHTKFVLEHPEIEFDDGWDFAEWVPLDERPKKKVEKIKPHPYYLCPCGLIVEYSCFAKHNRSFIHKNYEREHGIVDKNNINEWSKPSTEADFNKQRAESTKKKF